MSVSGPPNLIRRMRACFFFKQKTAYEMRISVWSSDVCSSDLRLLHRQTRLLLHHPLDVLDHDDGVVDDDADREHEGEKRDRVRAVADDQQHEIGRASCRERVCQYV